MATLGTATIRRLSDSNLTVAHPDEDVRGRKVLDKVGEEIGTVDDLLIDDRESKVRFLRVESGGFIGIGAKVFLIPVDAITQITDTAVHINRTREHVAGGPGYDPDLATDEADWGRYYNYYGYQPYWGVGYMYPLYPWYPMGTPPLRPEETDANPPLADSSESN